jgi:hypothetical protein
VKKPDQTPLDYAPARRPSHTPIDAGEIVLWVVWAMLLAFFAMAIIMSVVL